MEKLGKPYTASTVEFRRKMVKWVWNVSCKTFVHFYAAGTRDFRLKTSTVFQCWEEVTLERYVSPSACTLVLLCTKPVKSSVFGVRRRLGDSPSHRPSLSSCPVRVRLDSKIKADLSKLHVNLKYINNFLFQGAARRVQEVRQTVCHQSPEERRHCDAWWSRQVGHLKFIRELKGQYIPKSQFQLRRFVLFLCGLINVAIYQAGRQKRRSCIMGTLRSKIVKAVWISLALLLHYCQFHVTKTV